MKASDFDKAFDNGKDITLHLDMASARRPNQQCKEIQRVLTKKNKKYKKIKKTLDHQAASA